MRTSYLLKKYIYLKVFFQINNMILKEFVFWKLLRHKPGRPVKWQSTSWRPTRAARLWEVNFAQADSRRPFGRWFCLSLWLKVMIPLGNLAFYYDEKAGILMTAHLGGEKTEFAILQRVSRRPIRRWLFGFYFCTFSFY